MIAFVSKGGVPAAGSFNWIYTQTYRKFILIYCDCLLDKMIIEIKAFKIDCDIHYHNALITKLFINLYKMIIS